jgi:hypothetical protein
MAVHFKGAHFPPELILTCVRSSMVYPLSTRHVEELMQERGVFVDHATVNRWVLKYSPPLEDAFHRRKRPVRLSSHGLHRKLATYMDPPPMSRDIRTATRKRADAVIYPAC